MDGLVEYFTKLNFPDNRNLSFKETVYVSNVYYRVLCIVKPVILNRRYAREEFQMGIRRNLNLKREI